MKKYFRSYLDAMAYIRNNELKTTPYKSEVWLYLGRESVWTVNHD
jgi:hypothetical protein